MIDPAMLRIAGIEPPAEPKVAREVGGADFGQLLGDAIHEARSLETSSQDMSAKFAAGDPSVGIHEVMISTEKANIAVRYATTLRSKALEAYRELMNTQV